MGLVGYFRRLILGFSKLALPLIQFTGKGNLMYEVFSVKIVSKI